MATKLPNYHRQELQKVTNLKNGKFTFYDLIIILNQKPLTIAATVAHVTRLGLVAWTNAGVPSKHRPVVFAVPEPRLLTLTTTFVASLPWPPKDPFSVNRGHCKVIKQR